MYDCYIQRLYKLLERLHQYDTKACMETIEFSLACFY